MRPRTQSEAPGEAGTCSYPHPEVTQLPHSVLRPLASGRLGLRPIGHSAKNLPARRSGQRAALGGVSGSRGRGKGRGERGAREGPEGAARGRPLVESRAPEVPEGATTAPWAPRVRGDRAARPLVFKRNTPHLSPHSSFRGTEPRICDTSEAASWPGPEGGTGGDSRAEMVAAVTPRRPRGACQGAAVRPHPVRDGGDRPAPGPQAAPVSPFVSLCSGGHPRAEGSGERPRPLATFACAHAPAATPRAPSPGRRRGCPKQRGRPGRSINLQPLCVFNFIFLVSGTLAVAQLPGGEPRTGRDGSRAPIPGVPARGANAGGCRELRARRGVRELGCGPDVCFDARPVPCGLWLHREGTCSGLLSLCEPGGRPSPLLPGEVGALSLVQLPKGVYTRGPRVLL